MRSKTMDTQALRTQLGISGLVLMRNAEGITHEDSLKHPEMGGSCMNWVVGHLNRARAQLVLLLGKDAPFSPETFAMYHGGPKAPFDPDKAVRFEQLLEQFGTFERPIQEGLQSITAERMAEKAPFSPAGRPDETVGSLLATFAFHEAYHVGQSGVLRRVAGRPGVLRAPAEP
jgi:hypothetical protein